MQIRVLRCQGHKGWNLAGMLAKTWDHAHNTLRVVEKGRQMKGMYTDRQMDSEGGWRGEKSRKTNGN